MELGISDDIPNSLLLPLEDIPYRCLLYGDLCTTSRHLSIHFIVYRSIVLCVYGMINDTKRWYDKENHPTRRGFIQGRHASESIQESTECIFDPSRYACMREYYGLL